MGIVHDTQDRLVIAAYDAYKAGLLRALVLVAFVAQQSMAGSDNTALLPASERVASPVTPIILVSQRLACSSSTKQEAARARSCRKRS